MWMRPKCVLGSIYMPLRGQLLWLRPKNWAVPIANQVDASSIVLGSIYNPPKGEFAIDAS